MTNATIRKSAISFFTTAGMRRNEFVQNLLPWLIGVPVSLIIIRIFSL